MKSLLHQRKFLVALAAALVAVAVGSVWMGESNSAEKKSPGAPGANQSRSSRSSDRNTIAATGAASGRNRPAGVEDRAGARAPELPQHQTPEGIKRPKNADQRIIARGTGTTALGSRRSSQRGSRSDSSNRLASLLGASSLSARQRVGGLEELGANPLSSAELESAYDYLENTQIPDGISDEQHHWIVDELLTALRRDGSNVTEIATRLRGIYQDRSQHMVTRDYVLQHLGHLQHEGGDLDLIKRTLQAAVSETRGTLAGTALLALNQNDFPDPELGQAAFRVASNPSADLRSRLTALQVAGKQQHEEALPYAVEIAGDRTQPVPLRMSAIAIIGDLRATEEQPLLEGLVHSADSRLRSAAESAIAKLVGDQ